MTGKAPLSWRFSIASLSLLAAAAVYSFARFHPPELLETFQATNPVLATQTLVFGSAPSLLYTLALGLFIGACASTLAEARILCLAWIGLAIGLELAQHPIVAGHLSTWLAAVSSESIWALIGPYWTRGVFDPLDLLATLVGGYIALLLLNHLLTENTDASTS